MRGRPVLALLLALAVGGCGQGSADTESAGGASGALGTPIEVTGADGEPLRLVEPPDRIVALVPSMNQILVELGAANRLVGRTDYDTLASLAGLPSVGGGIGPDMERLVGLRPDLVIRFDGPSDARTADRLADLGIPHLGVRPDGIDDVLELIETLGAVVREERRAAEMTSRIEGGLRRVRDAVRDADSLRVAFLLGGSPPLAAGPGTFLHELVEIAGGRNVFGDLGELYSPVAIETAVSREIDVVLLSEGARVDPRILEGRRVGRVPGWVQLPGPGIVASAAAVARAIHGDLPGLPPP